MKSHFLLALTLGLGLAPRVARAETLHLALEENGFPPFYFKPGDSRVGIYDQIIKGVEARTHDVYQVVYLPQKRKLEAFRKGTVDIEPGVNPAWRAEDLAISAYSVPFANAEDVLLARPDDTRPRERPSDLKGQTLGCITGYSYPELQPLFAAGTVKRDDSRTEEIMMRKLVLKRVDAAIAERVIAEYERKVHPELQVRFGGVVSSKPLTFRFRKEKGAALARFDAALAKLKADGTLTAIFAQYQ